MIRKIITGILVCSLTLFTLTSCTKKEEITEEKKAENNQKIFEVKTVSPEYRNLDQILSATGTANADREITISATVSGVLEQVFVEVGDYVKEGDSLAEIDTVKHKLYLEQGQAAFAQAKASYENARLELERKKKLLDRNAISQGMFDSIEARYEAMKAAKEMATVQMKLAEKTYSDSKVPSPLEGFISERFRERGEYVDTMTSGPIMSIVKTDPIRVKFSLPEKYSSMMKRGYEFTARFSSLPNEEFNGKISIVSPAVDTETRTISLEGKIANRKFRIKPGTFAEIELKMNGNGKSMVIPRKAIFSEQGQKFVYLVVDGKAVKTKIKPGTLTDGYEEVLDGLTDEDAVIIDGANGIYNGAEVKVKNSRTEEERK